MENSWTGLDRVFLVSQSSDKGASQPVVVLIGSRSATQAEKERLWASEVTVVEEQSVRALGAREALGIPLNAMAGKVRRVHVHLDLDVLDPEAVNPANEFAPEGGLRAEEVEASSRRSASALRLPPRPSPRMIPPSIEKGAC